MTGPQDEFEDRLRRLLDRAAGELPVPPGVWRGPSERSPAHKPRRPTLGTIATVLAAGIAVAIAVFALVSLRGGPSHRVSHPTVAVSPGPLLPPHPTPQQLQALSYLAGALGVVQRADSACRPRRNAAPIDEGSPGPALLSILGALRRTARPADHLSRTALSPLASGVLISYARRVAQSGGLSLYLVPARVPMSPMTVPARCLAKQREALRRELPRIPRPVRAATLALEPKYLARLRSRTSSGIGICLLLAGPGRPGGGECVGDGVRAIEAGQVLGFGQTGVYGVVPDGVATVTLHYPGQIVIAHVVDNVFFLNERLPRNGSPSRIVWRTADGRIVHPAFGGRPSGPSFGFSSGPKGGAFCRQNPAAC